MSSVKYIQLDIEKQKDQGPRAVGHESIDNESIDNESIDNESIEGIKQLETQSNRPHKIMEDVSKAFIQTQIKKQPDIDYENDVSLFCADYDKEIQHPSNTKGYVFHGDKLFFQGFPYSKELNLNSFDESVAPFSEIDLKNCRIFESHEGTLIRVFNINNVWYTSTNRKLDALKSKWAAKHTTFGQHFAAAVRDIVDDEDEDEVEVEDEVESVKLKYKDRIKVQNSKNKAFLTKIYKTNLDPLKKYMFILKPSEEERIVCRTEPSPTIYHIGTFDKDNVLSFDEEVSLNGIKIETPKERFFKDWHDLRNSIDNININYHQGYVVIQKKNNDKHYKIINDRYRYLFSVRGNVPSLKFRYLQLRKYGSGSIKNAPINQKMYESFLDLYNYHNEAMEIEKEIYELSKDLHQKYLLIYVEKKRILNISEAENDVLQNIIHKSYLDTRLKTTVSKINDLLTLEKPSKINKLLQEKKTQKDSIRALGAWERSSVGSGS